jgi:hypothetical protein
MTPRAGPRPPWPTPPSRKVPQLLAETPPEPTPEAGAGEAAAPDPESGPLRRCLVTRARHPKEAMLRFVVAPDGTVLPDLAARLPGRGMWLSARADVLEAALKRGALVRAAAKAVAAQGGNAAGTSPQPRLPADLAQKVVAGLEARLADTLGLARRAGQAVCGFEAVREWAAKGRVGLLVEASDGASGGRGKMTRLLPDVPSVAPLDAFALGRVFGRDHAVHVGIAQGRLASLVAMESGRLMGMRPSAAMATRTEPPSAADDMKRLGTRTGPDGG